MVAFHELPLFPLNTVLFPGMLLPLHIFEERYKIMIHYCLTHKRPFGVVFIQTGDEVGSNADIFDIGTTAHITQVDQFEDGRMNIATVGVSRFKIHTLDPAKEPYLVGQVEDYPLEEGDSESIDTAVQHLEPFLLNYLKILSQVSKARVQFDHLPKDATTLAYLTAILLQTPLPEKQKLLSNPSLLNLLQKEKALLQQETQTLKLLVQNAPKWRDDDLLFSPN